MRKYKLQELCLILGVENATITKFVQKEWIIPANPQGEFDDEDLARTRLILDLVNSLSVNDEAVPVILHLIDQIHHLHHRIHFYSQDKS